MEKCRTCALRYECKGKTWYDCQMSDYELYVADDKAIVEAEKEIQECKGADNGGNTIKWIKGTKPLPLSVSDELNVGKTPEEVVDFAIVLAEVFESKTQYSYAEGMIGMAKLVNALPEDVCKKMDEKLLSIRDKCFGSTDNVVTGV